jgi:hypothetical protein
MTICSISEPPPEKGDLLSRNFATISNWEIIYIFLGDDCQGKTHVFAKFLDSMIKRYYTLWRCLITP